jgi:DEAD/DEAH box helicase domain-containing protein
MNYHSLLDWRLGLSMLRVMNDSTFVCGADGNFKFIELQNWLAFATELRNTFAQSFGFTNTVRDKRFANYQIWKKPEEM